MKVSFQHANPWDGRESFLIRFQDDIHNETVCILIDSGDGVDVANLLSDDEHLSAILLTHAHLDHYQTLGDNLCDGAKIYATSETVATMEQVIAANGEHATLSKPDQIKDALTPVEGWMTITPEIRVHSVPAGHAPGAAGFVIQFDDGSNSHHLLATGDFTTQPVAGYPGLPTDLLADIDAVFLTAASTSTATHSLTEAIETILKRAYTGSTVLTTASGLTGVHLAYLIANLCEDSEISIPVTLVGRIAALWKSFGYDESIVEPVKDFSDPKEVLQSGQITIAGPEVPDSGSSHRLFNDIIDDSSSTLVQVTSGAFDPLESHNSSGTVYDFEVSYHPTEETIDGVVDDLDPIQVVITHQSGIIADRYKDKFDSFVWVCEDADEHILYNGQWVSPPWVTDGTARRIRSQQYSNGGSTLMDSLASDNVPLPMVERTEEGDLAAEGINVDRFVEIYEASQVGSSVDSLEIADEKETESTSNESASNEQVVKDEAVLEEINDRLSRLEGTIGGDSTRVRVVDAGDGMVLLRPLEESVGTELSHGEVVEITISKTEVQD